jgi:hypothetical protein
MAISSTNPIMLPEDTLSGSPVQHAAGHIMCAALRRGKQPRLHPSEQVASVMCMVGSGGRAVSPATCSADMWGGQLVAPAHSHTQRAVGGCEAVGPRPRQTEGERTEC